MTTRALVGNSTDKKQIAKGKRTEHANRERELHDLGTVLSIPQGQRVLWRLLERCGVYKTSISTDPYATYYNEGERNIGLFLMSEINEVDPQALADMTRMAKSDREIEEAERSEAVAAEDEDDGN